MVPSSEAVGSGLGNAHPPTRVTPPRPLKISLSPASLRNIAAAEAAFDKLVDAHEVKSHHKEIRNS